MFQYILISNNNRSGIQVVIVEFEATEPLIAAKHYLFPNTSNISSRSNSSSIGSVGGRVYYSTCSGDESTDPDYIEHKSSRDDNNVDDDSDNLCCYANSTGKIASFSKSKRDYYQQQADSLLQKVYGNSSSSWSDRKDILYVHVQPPLVGSSSSSYLANTASKYSCNISAATDIEVDSNCYCWRTLCYYFISFAFYIFF